MFQPNSGYWTVPLIIAGRLIELSGYWRLVKILPDITDCRQVKRVMRKGESYFVRGYGLVIAKDWRSFGK